MEPFLIYSLKASIIIALFWSIYKLFLQKETFFRFNRFFLLTGLIAALTFPFITIHYSVEVPTPETVQSISDISTIPPASFLQNLPPTIHENALLVIEQNSVLPQKVISSILHKTLQFLHNHLIYFTAIYYVILAIMLLVQGIGFFRIFKIIRRNLNMRYSGYILIESDEITDVFSLFRYVLIPACMQKSEKDIILTHEKAHIDQKHWIDLFVTNVLRLMWWFNPLILFYEKAIRTNHEYAADFAVLGEYRQVDFQQTLINQWFKTQVFPLALNFAFSNPLKRIYMMKKTISNPLKKLFSLTVIPVLAFFFFAFSKKEYVTNDADVNLPVTIEAEATPQVASEHVIVKQLKMEAEIIQELRSRKIADVQNSIDSTKADVLQSRLYSVAKLTLRDRFEVANIQSEMGSDTLITNPLIIVDGIEKDADYVKSIYPGDIESFSILTNAAAAAVYGERGKNGSILVITKKGVKEPSVNEGFNIQSNLDSIKNQQSFRTSNGYRKTPLYLLDGEEVVEDDLKKLNEADIESFSVLKDPASVASYGVNGINGVILVTTKKGKK